MTNDKTKKQVWLVEHPTYRYEQDVKALARKADLRIVDAAEASDSDRKSAVSAKDAPKLTLKPEHAPAKADEKKE